MNTLSTVEIPADVRDNSETVTDYAFMRHLAQSDFPYHTVETRDAQIRRVPLYPYLYLTHYQWYDVNPSGQRCRFDVIVNGHGDVTDLFHTEYFSRVACVTHEASYAQRYASVDDGAGIATIASPYCGMCLVHLRRSAKDSGMTISESEPMYIGQHD